MQMSKSDDAHYISDTYINGFCLNNVIQMLFPENALKLSKIMQDITKKFNLSDYRNFPNYYSNT